MGFVLLYVEHILRLDIYLRFYSISSNIIAICNLSMVDILKMILNHKFSRTNNLSQASLKKNCFFVHASLRSRGLNLTLVKENIVFHDSKCLQRSFFLFVYIMRITREFNYKHFLSAPINTTSIEQKQMHKNYIGTFVLKNSVTSQTLLHCGMETNAKFHNP